MFKINKNECISRSLIFSMVANFESLFLPVVFSEQQWIGKCIFLITEILNMNWIKQPNKIPLKCISLVTECLPVLLIISHLRGFLIHFSGLVLEFWSCMNRRDPEVLHFKTFWKWFWLSTRVVLLTHTIWPYNIFMLVTFS